MESTKAYRYHECMRCGHSWEAPIVLSNSTQNLSGERTAWCPRCGSGSVASSAAFEKEPISPEAIRDHSTQTGAIDQ
jgi:DNA-directed RNA polymerase subunit RPC12/RpoP